MKAAALIGFLFAFFPSGAYAADETCFQQYGFCMGYCDKLSSLCALRCDDRRLACERSPVKKKPRLKQMPVPAVVT
jgi:hypothetical protein